MVVSIVRLVLFTFVESVFNITGQYHLNRQVVTLMSGLGIEDHLFLTLQEQVLNKLAKMFVYEEEAVSALERYITHEASSKVCKVLLFMIRNNSFALHIMSIVKVQPLLNFTECNKKVFVLHLAMCILFSGESSLPFH